MVIIGDIIFDRIEPGADRNAQEAFNHAVRYHELAEMEVLGAIINARDGLVLLDDLPDVAARGYHFRNLVCGSYGQSSQYAAIVLMMFKLDHGEPNLYGRLSTWQHCKFPVL